MPIPVLLIIFVILYQLTDVSYVLIVNKGRGTKKTISKCIPVHSKKFRITAHIGLILLNFFIVCEINIINYTSTLNVTFSYLHIHIKYMLASMLSQVPI